MKRIILEDYNRKDVFDVVSNFPNGYIVWPIGRHNFPIQGYIPLAKPLGDFKIDIKTLKTLKCPTDKIADIILDKAVRTGVNQDEYYKIIEERLEDDKRRKTAKETEKEKTSQDVDAQGCQFPLRQL